MKIGIDVMGGDNGTLEVVNGVVLASKEFDDFFILLGNKEEIKQKLPPNIEIYHVSEKIQMGDPPIQAVKRKKNSSIVVGMNLLKKKIIDAFISAGNTGAVIAAAFLIKNIEGAIRPAIAAVIPTMKGQSVLLDVGANLDCKPQHLLRFGIMGCVYIREMFGIENPKVGLLSIGNEEDKGDELRKISHRMFKETRLVNFIGNIEGSDIISGKADTIVCDAFVGNIVLKLIESSGEAIISILREKLSPPHPFFDRLFDDIKSKFDYAYYGGAPLLGMNDVCIICHGKSNSFAVKNAIKLSKEIFEKKITQKINQEMKKCNLL